MNLPTLLITGFNGTVGQILWRNLADVFELYGLDLNLDKEEKNTFRADISNFEQVNAAFEHMPSMAYVVHLAGDPRPNADWQSVLLNNIGGTRNVYEAAQTHGVKR
jgi:NAD+ dependent glucose-6-phosphate dehydrogenase